jgi:hypothetical protein
MSKVLEIRSKRQSGFTVGTLAEEYGVTLATIYRVVSGKTWKHVLPVWPFGAPDPRETPRGPDPSTQYGHLRNPN